MLINFSFTKKFNFKLIPNFEQRNFVVKIYIVNRREKREANEQVSHLVISGDFWRVACLKN